MKGSTKIAGKPLLTDVFDILMKNLGPQKTLEFWRLVSRSKIDYLDIKKEIFKSKSLENIYNEAKKFNR